MSRSLTDWRPQRVVVGAVGKAHGLDGATHLVGYGGVVPIARGTEVLIGDRPAVVVERKGTHDRPIVRFDVAATRDAIEELRGMDVTVAAGSLPDTDDDEFFHVDLLGCQVRSGDRVLGRVTRVHEYPANDVLELDGGEMIPFVEDVVVSVDIPGRRLNVVEGFLE
jgi:16S rRNA processing protein RimM